MKTFNITNKASGVDLGNYDAPNELGALDAMARDAGYRDYAELQTVAPCPDNEIIVTEIPNV